MEESDEDCSLNTDRSINCDSSSISIKINKNLEINIINKVKHSLKDTAVAFKIFFPLINTEFLL